MSVRQMCSLFSLAALGFVAGCSSNSNPPTIPVTGIVTLDGKPVSGAMVKFEPSEGSQVASGTSDANGKYVLGTFAGGDGAMKGKYGVSVTKIQTEAGTSSYELSAQTPAPEVKSDGKDQKLDDMYAAYGNAYKGTPKDAGKGKQPAAKNDLPKKYEQANTSGLSFEVTEKCPSINLELKSK